jgi:hypothetical protein
VLIRATTYQDELGELRLKRLLLLFGLAEHVLERVRALSATAEERACPTVSRDSHPPPAPERASRNGGSSFVVISAAPYPDVPRALIALEM